jgi:hypothetical protein
VPGMGVVAGECNFKDLVAGRRRDGAVAVLGRGAGQLG